MAKSTFQEELEALLQEHGIDGTMLMIHVPQEEVKQPIDLHQVAWDILKKIAGIPVHRVDPSQAERIVEVMKKHRIQ